MAARSEWTVNVKTIDGEIATLQLQQDIFDIPVAALVEAACDKIGNNNYYTAASAITII